MRWLLRDVDWSLGNNRIHCSSGASLQANRLALQGRIGQQYAKRLVHRVFGGDIVAVKAGKFAGMIAGIK